MSTHEDPITGYNTSTYGINGVMLAGAMGLMRVAAANGKCRSHIICSDFVVSATLSAVWDLCVATGDKATTKEVPKIYTVTVNQDELRWGKGGVGGCETNDVLNFQIRSCASFYRRHEQTDTGS